VKTHPALETAASYLHVNQLAHANRPDSTAEPFVTISRETGAGASEVAAALQHRMADETGAPWSVLESNLINEMLQANHLPPRLAAFLPEGRVPEIQAIVGEIVGLHPNLWELAVKTDTFMRRIAVRGRVILVGRGGCFATAGLPNGVHVRLVAPTDHRARTMAKRHNVSEESAAEHNRRQDRARRRYVKSHFNAIGPDSTNFDLVVNTARVPLNQAVDLISALVRARTPAPV
jgi:hypothetical protein